MYAIGQQAIPWPGLHNAISITLYGGKPYAAVWAFQPLATGTAILVACVITALVVRLAPGEFLGCVGKTIRQVWLAVVTVMLIIGLAYLMNYSGLVYTLGKGVASTGYLFVLLSPFLGWVAVMLSGSDTSGNALFGNLQVVAAKQLNLNPILFAATNSSGGVMGKMISPQNIATGVSVTNLRGQEGVVFARTFWHSIVLTLLLSLLVVVQQFVIPWVIPTVGVAGRLTEGEAVRNETAFRIEVDYPALAQALEAVAPKARIAVDPLRTLCYGTDASFYRLIPKSS